jgi:predicted DNA binding protein
VSYRGDQSRKSDLFSALQPENASASASKQDSAVSYALLANLSSALRYLDDDQLDRLLAALLAEQERRGKEPSSSNASSIKRRVETVAVPLTTSKLNVVRAAFKAGVKPSQIARQFGLSQSDVRKALPSHERK